MLYHIVKHIMSDGNYYEFWQNDPREDGLVEMYKNTAKPMEVVGTIDLVHIQVGREAEMEKLFDEITWKLGE